MFCKGRRRTIRIIDFHTHIFPETIADKAVEFISGYYNVPAACTGKLENLLETSKEINVYKNIVLPTAIRPDQVYKINEWAASIKNERIIFFGAIHPNCDDIKAEVEHIISLGLQGIKMHPDFQDFEIDSKSAYLVYEAVDDKLPIMIHLGDENHTRSTPKRLSRVLDDFPNLTVIGAHLGGYMQWDETREHLAGRDLYFDTSSALWCMNPYDAAELIRLHGTNQVLFGTDYPITAHKDELNRFMALPLTEQEREDILYNNACCLLGI